MKNKIFFALIFAAFGLMGLNSCKEKEMDTPPFHIPEADTTGGKVITIAELKDLAPNLSSPGVFKIDSNYFVKGVITANDESGNIYKKLYIQSGDFAIAISVDAKSLYLKYRVGQTVYLKCKGNYLGNSYGIYQFGGIYNGGPGRITLSDTLKIDDVIMQDGLPDLNNVPEPKTVFGATGFTNDDVSRLVKVTNVSFVDGGVKLFANVGESFPERTVKDASGNTIILSNSAFASFAADTLPIGSGDITGILGLFQSSYRLIIRDLNDIDFYTPVFSEIFTTEPSTWTKTSISGTGVWGFNTTDKCMKISGWISGETTPNEDWLISPSFDISTATNPVLSFSNRRRFADTETEPMAVYVTTDNTATASTPEKWTKLSATFDTNTGSSFTGWISSGNIDLSAYASSNVRIAFKYKSSSNGSGTASYWDIDNISVIDK